MSGGNILALLSRKRRIIYHEIHGDSRLGDLLEGYSHRISIRTTDRISDMDVSYTGDRDNGTDTRLLHVHLVKSVELVKLADAHPVALVRIMMVYDKRFLIEL